MDTFSFINQIKNKEETIDNLKREVDISANRVNDLLTEVILAA